MAPNGLNAHTKYGLPSSWFFFLVLDNSFGLLVEFQYAGEWITETQGFESWPFLFEITFRSQSKIKIKQQICMDGLMNGWT